LSHYIFPFYLEVTGFRFFFRPSFVTALVLSGANLVSRTCSSRFEMHFLGKSSLRSKSILPRKNVGIGFYGRQFSHHKTRSGSSNKEAELREKINEFSNLIIESTMDKNIQESKEFRLAKDLEMAVNSFSFNPKRFAAAIPTMHPTLQQSLYRLIKECIKVMADDTRYYDDRNMASHEEAKCMMEYLNKYGRNIPLK
jgi:hypothetical protein